MSRRTCGHFRTLEEVRAERYRIDLEIEKAGRRLEQDREQIRGMFRISYWVNGLFKKSSKVTANLPQILTGFSVVSSLARKIRNFKRWRTKR